MLDAAIVEKIEEAVEKVKVRKQEARKQEAPLASSLHSPLSTSAGEEEH